MMFNIAMIIYSFLGVFVMFVLFSLFFFFSSIESSFVLLTTILYLNTINATIVIPPLPQDSQNMFLNTNSSFQSALVSGVTTLKRTKNRRGSALPNAKKMYEEAQMVRRVRSYLSTMPIVDDESKLKDMSEACEAPGIVNCTRLGLHRHRALELSDCAK